MEWINGGEVLMDGVVVMEKSYGNGARKWLKEGGSDGRTEGSSDGEGWKQEESNVWKKGGRNGERTEGSSDDGIERGGGDGE